MNQYTAKYYPIINGKETEYVTTVEARDKKSAESTIRRAFIEQLEGIARMVMVLSDSKRDMLCSVLQKSFRLYKERL